MQLQLNQLTADLRAILDRAQQEAAYRHAPYVDVEHLALGLFKHPAGTAHTLFEQHHVDTTALYDRVAGAVGMKRDEPITVKGYTNAANTALQHALDEARHQRHIPLAAGHLLIALMGETEGVIHDVLADLPFDAETVRTYLLDIDPPKLASDAPPLMPVPDTGRPTGQADQANEPPPEIIVIPTIKSRSKKQGDSAQDGMPPWMNTALIIGGVVALIVYMIMALPGSTLLTFVIVLGGWIFSLTLHEFSHALVAYWGGDYTVADKGYLSFNPLRYTHPLLSIVMPLVFLAMGGIGLPGGAVYIERHRLRSKWWGAAVSAAGPLANLLFALVLSLPFLLGLVDPQTIFRNYVLEQSGEGFFDNPEFWSAIAFLAMLQITAVFFNLLPIPPLDGFGIIEPFLDEETRFQLRRIGFSGGLLLIIFLFWYVQPVSDAFWNTVYDLTDSLSIPDWMIIVGRDAFMFWRK